MNTSKKNSMRNSKCFQNGSCPYFFYFNLLFLFVLKVEAISLSPSDININLPDSSAFNDSSDYTPPDSNILINQPLEIPETDLITTYDTYPDVAEITSEQRDAIQNLVMQLYFPDNEYQQVKQKVDDLVNSWISLNQGVPLIRMVISSNTSGLEFNWKGNVFKINYNISGINSPNVNSIILPLFRESQDIIQFSRKYFGETQPASYLSLLLPQSLFVKINPCLKCIFNIFK